MAQAFKPKEYKKLNGAVAYDHEAAEELAEALNEIKLLQGRINLLNQLALENKELHNFVWTTATGEAKAIHDIDDNHLENIMLHLLRSNRSINRGIRGEAVKRGLTIPVSVPIDWEPTGYLEARRNELEDRM